MAGEFWMEQRGTKSPPPSYMEQEELLVRKWNRSHRVGTPVIVHRDNGEDFKTKTRTRAQLLSGHSAVVWVEGLASCYSAHKIEPIGREMLL